MSSCHKHNSKRMLMCSVSAASEIRLFFFQQAVEVFCPLVAKKKKNQLLHLLRPQYEESHTIIQTMLIYGRLRDLEALVWKTLSHPKLYVLICSATQSQLQQTQPPYINSRHLHRKDALSTVQHQLTSLRLTFRNHSRCFSSCV